MHMALLDVPATHDRDPHRETITPHVSRTASLIVKPQSDSIAGRLSRERVKTVPYGMVDDGDIGADGFSAEILALAAESVPFDSSVTATRMIHEPKTYKQAVDISNPYRQQWLDAVSREMESMEKNKVFTVADLPHGFRFMNLN